MKSASAASPTSAGMSAEVAQAANGNAKRGLNTARLDANHLAPGVYFVKLVCGDATRSTKVVIE